MTALVGSTVGFHPLIVPSPLLKMNKAGPDLPFLEITKFEVALAIIPVGEPTGPNGWLGAAGIVTTSGIDLP